MGMTVEYEHNNSGGKWWLEDKDWYALEAAGWTVNWHRDKSDAGKGLLKADEEGRWLRGLAYSASIRVEHENIHEVISQWETVTGMDSAALGCFTCCGPPHSFRVKFDNGKELSLSPEPTGSHLTSGW